jgi:dihydrofolate synthase / folylpolyglutamate synthase
VSGYPADPELRAVLAGVERDIVARRPEHSIDPSLERIADLVTLLGDPQRACPVIHITGTNGKTSTARMIDALLRARGLRTGLFTSPHLTSMRERICLDGEPIDAERFVGLYEELLPYLAIVDERHGVRLSFFEVLTGMAFAAFADAPVDVAVVEVGVGGTWDSTNVADGAVAVITPISIDHTRYLGSTVEAIATDKSGIIKPGAVAVLAQQPLAAAEVLLRRVSEVGATVAREGLEFGVLDRGLAVGGQQVELRGLRGDYHDLFLPLFGGYQAGNAACALAAVEAFAGVNNDAPGEEGEPVPLDETWVREAFASVRSPGRLEVVRRSPLTLVDAAHNPAGMAASMEAITEAFALNGLVCVLAVSEDKDIPGMLDELEPVADSLVATRNSSARSMEVAKLADLAEAVFGPDRVHRASRLDEAIDMAVTLADEATALDDGAGTVAPGGTGVLITGSVITAGDARMLLVSSARPDRDGPVDQEPWDREFTGQEARDLEDRELDAEDLAQDQLESEDLEYEDLEDDDLGDEDLTSDDLEDGDFEDEDLEPEDLEPGGSDPE